MIDSVPSPGLPPTNKLNTFDQVSNTNQGRSRKISTNEKISSNE